MIRIQLDFGALEAWPSDRLPGFTECLLAVLPGLAQRGCCYHEAGGFVRRLRLDDQSLAQLGAGNASAPASRVAHRKLPPMPPRLILIDAALSS
jgi:hypothetical protein